jgi:NIMA (never in mitosis gene a)-related kinase
VKEKHKKKATTGTLEYFSEEQILSWFTQICLALKHIHDRKILHRDLKSQNIFLTKRDFVKLGDFGIARVLSNTKSNAKTIVGTPYYLSPEIIENQPYSFKSDIWSLGVLLFEMCALQPPFNATSLHQLAQRIVQGKFDKLPRQYSSSLNSLLAAILVRDPKRRPTINDILKYPMIKRRIDAYLEEDEFKDEFTHTLLHDQNVFMEFQRRKKDEDERKRREEEEEKKKQEERVRQQQMQAHILENIKRQREEEEARGKLKQV